MHFSMIIKLCSLLPICRQVSSSQYSFLQNDTFRKEENFDNVLKKFFDDLNEGYLEQNKPQHVTVLGASASEFQQTQSLFENYPYIICKTTESCASSEQYCRGNFVIVFFEDFNEETFAKNTTILAQCRECEFLFVYKGIIGVHKAWLMVTSAMRDRIRYSKFAHHRKNAIELYSDFITTNCSKDVKLVGVWKPGSSLNEIKTWASQSYDMNGCPVSVSSLNLTPKMMIKENENGSLIIAGGREGNLLMALAWKLNFTIRLRNPSIEFQMKYSRKIAIIYDLVRGFSELGIGRLRPDHNLTNTMAVSYPYDEECVTWGVPRILKWSKNIVWVEFSWEVWASVGLVFAVGCIIKHANKNTVKKKMNEEKMSGFVLIVVDTVALHVGTPVMNVSSSAGGKFMLVAYLYYAMVVTTAYKTSLASILAAGDGASTIVDAAGIINANLNIGGSLFDYTILENQINDSKYNSKLLKRFVINNNESVSWNELFSGKDWAILGRRSYLNYNRQLFLKSQNSVTFNVFNGCVLAYPTVIYYRTRLLVSNRLDNVIQRLVESGITTHWDINELDADVILKQKTIESYFDKRATDKFQTIFIYYSYPIFISLFTFFIELLMPRFDSRKQQHATNRVNNT